MLVPFLQLLIYFDLFTKIVSFRYFLDQFFFLGRANLVLSNHKKYLLAEVENLKQLEIDVENIKLQNKELLEENEEVLLQVEKEKVNYDKIKTYVESYSVGL